MQRLFSVVLLSSLATAQPAVDLVRPTDAVVLQVDGPEALRLAFLPTSVGGLLAAQEARGFQELLAKLLEKRVGELSSVDPRPALDALRGYRGRATVAVGLSKTNRYFFEGVMILAPDGETDLAALGERLTAFLKGAGDDGRDAIRVGASHAKVYSLAGTSVTEPVLLDRHLVTFFGSGLDRKTIERRQTPGGGWKADAEFRESPIAVRLRLPALLSREGASWVGDAKLAALLGFDSLAEARVLVRPAGPRVEIELSIAFDGDDRGIFAGILPANAKPPSLLDLVPPEHPDWVAGKFGVGTLVEETLDAVDQWAPGLVDEETSVTALGMAAAMGEDYVKVGSLLGRDGDVGEFCLAFELRDPKAFDETFWPSLGEDPDQYAADLADGEVVTYDHDFLFHCVFARWSNLVFLHSGDRGEIWFGQMLRRARQSRGAGNKVVLPDGIARLGRAFGPGYQGCARIDVRDLARSIPGLRFLWPTEREYRQQVACVRDLTAELAPLLEKYHCETAYAVTGWRGRSWRARLFW